VPKVQVNAPVFQTIKNYLLKEIQSGTWKEGDAIPSEAMLAEQFNVSRMTVNRAVRELTSEQILHRIQGSGTYVAQQKYQATLVEIKSIAEEIRSRGHVHRSELHLLASILQVSNFRRNLWSNRGIVCFTQSSFTLKIMSRFR
jgi:GntR family histidine utilization transcriptional repressor